MILFEILFDVLEVFEGDHVFCLYGNYLRFFRKRVVVVVDLLMCRLLIVCSSSCLLYFGLFWADLSCSAFLCLLYEFWLLYESCLALFHSYIHVKYSSTKCYCIVLHLFLEFVYSLDC